MIRAPYRRDPEVPCVVCGEPARKRWIDKATGEPRSARSKSSQTCASPECAATIIIHPELVDRSRTVLKSGHRAGRRQRTLEHFLGRPGVEFLAEVADGLIIDEAQLKLERTPASEMRQNPRWSAYPDEVRDDPWSRASRVSCMLRVVGEAGLASIRVYRSIQTEPVGRIIKRAWGLRHTHLCDVFYAWRCPCAVDHKVTYKTIHDLPSTLGYHDACPRCGSAPLEVLSRE